MDQRKKNLCLKAGSLSSNKKLKSQYEETQCTRTFKASWKTDFPWVEHDEKGKKMYCNVCRPYSNLAEGNAMFIRTSSFHIQNLKVDSASKLHKSFIKAQAAKDNPIQAPIIYALCNMEAESCENVNIARLKRSYCS